MSPENRNDDDVHGLGNEFGANTKGGQGSPSWWHDAAQKMTGDCHGGNCKMIGKETAETRFSFLRFVMEGVSTQSVHSVDEELHSGPRYILV